MRSHMGIQFAFVIGGSLLLAIAIAVMVFAIGNSATTTDAAEPGVGMQLNVSGTYTCAGGDVAGKVCVEPGNKFEIIIATDGIPASGYGLARGFIDYDTQGPSAQEEHHSGMAGL